MDSRIRYTKFRIKIAFFELLKNCPVDKMTVKGICDIAMVNRATFYKYYDSAADLMEKIEAEMLDSLEEQIKRVDLTNLRANFTIILKDIHDNVGNYKLLFEKSGDGRFRDRFFALFYNRNMEVIDTYFPDMGPVDRHWLYYFIAEGLIGIMKAWMAEDCREPIENVVGFMAALIDTMNNNFKGR
ncbi:MAG: TetR family transcriptional regulator C-terminal domain-containing protein [Lachnospiraceae bacterium]|nr:TetR family transcriptional regulator C-terminal domain-containing protein [Lachnospiraceae bacterium]